MTDIVIHIHITTACSKLLHTRPVASNFGLVQSGSGCSFKGKVDVFSERKWACLAAA